MASLSGCACCPPADVGYIFERRAVQYRSCGALNPADSPFCQRYAHTVETCVVGDLTVTVSVTGPRARMIFPSSGPGCTSSSVTSGTTCSGGTSIAYSDAITIGEIDGMARTAVALQSYSSDSSPTFLSASGGTNIGSAIDVGAAEERVWVYSSEPGEGYVLNYSLASLTGGVETILSTDIARLSAKNWATPTDYFPATYTGGVPIYVKEFTWPIPTAPGCPDTQKYYYLNTITRI